MFWDYPWGNTHWIYLKLALSVALEWARRNILLFRFFVRVLLFGREIGRIYLLWSVHYSTGAVLYQVVFAHGGIASPDSDFYSGNVGTRTVSGLGSGNYDRGG
jgi:hypothetical protein